MADEVICVTGLICPDCPLSVAIAKGEPEFGVCMRCAMHAPELLEMTPEQRTEVWALSRRTRLAIARASGIDAPDSHSGDLPE